jgi:uncharacterized protein (TIGR02996 family)
MVPPARRAVNGPPKALAFRSARVYDAPDFSRRRFRVRKVLVNEHDALLATIATNPDEDAPRLVYADWLDEHDDPERAKFVRVQIAAHRNSDAKGELTPAEVAVLAVRKRELLERNRDRWLEPVNAVGTVAGIDIDFSRGFVWSVVLEAGAFLERGADLWKCLAGSTLQLRNVGPVAKQLSRCPHFAHVHALSLIDHIAPNDLRALLESPHLARLRRLALGNIRYKDQHIQLLATSTALPALERLTLECVPITGVTLPALLARLPRLRNLRLSLERFDAGALPDTLGALNPDHFRVLDIDWTPLGTVGMRAIASAARLTGIEELWLRNCRFDAGSVAALARAAHLSRLAELSLSDALGAGGGTALAEWPGLRSVRALNLDGCRIEARGAVALARSPHFGRLEELHLGANGLADAGAEAIAASASFSELRELDLPHNAITARGARALARSAHLRHLRKLDLEGNAIGNTGARALAASPALSALRWLTAADNNIGPKAGRKLLDALPHLTAF